MKSLSFHWFLKTEKIQPPYPQTTEAVSIPFQCTGCFTTFLSLRKSTVDCSSQKYKNNLPLFTCTSPALFSYSPTKLSKFACRESRKERRQRRLRIKELQCNYMLMEKKKTQRKKVLCRFFKPVLSMAPNQDPSLLGNNC